MRESEKANITFKNGVFEFDASAPKIGGADHKWYLQGDFPLPVSLFVISWTRFLELEFLLSQFGTNKIKKKNLSGGIIKKKDSSF